MTKAQKEEKARNERKLQQMKEAGLIIGGEQDGEKPKKEKPTFEKKTKSKQQQKVSSATVVEAR